jgi:CSLREA domain-containing protein
MVSNQRLRLPRAPFRRRLLVTVIGLVGILGVAPLYAATITVTTSADNVTVDGLCTLREAITANNAGADSADCINSSALPWGTADTIAFNIPGAGVHTIQPASILPSNNRTVIINGYTQPGAAVNTNDNRNYPAAQGLNTALLIELDGSLVGGASDALTLNVNASRVKGLSIVNFASGAAVMVNSNGNEISGNFLGMHVDGVTAGANRYGVYLNVGALMNAVGGAYASDRNLIAANAHVNIFNNTAHATTISGNLIGTDSSGTLARSPLGSGIMVSDAVNVDISGNVIAGHLYGGIQLVGARNSIVKDNSIGEGVGGVALGNRSGITIVNNPSSSAHTNVIWSNGITASEFYGIHVIGSAANGDPYGNRFDNNFIYANTELGINLQPDGEGGGIPTPNDSLDADSGPNGLQNYPVITSAQVNGASGIDIAFTLNSTPNTQIDISAYSSPACNAKGYGEGRYGTGLFNTTLVTDASGDVAGTVTVPAPLPTGWGAGSFVALLAHAIGAANTSEFSACAQVAAATGVPPAMGDVPDQNATVGVPFSLDLSGYVTMTDGNPIAGYAVASGSLPPGLALDAATGVISGTPTTAGIYNVTVTASDTDGASNADAVQFTVAASGTPPAISSGTLPGGVIGTPYSFTVTANGTAPITFSDFGTLPPGLALDAASGVISGTPITIGDYNVVIRASNGILPNADGYYSVTVSTSAVTSYTGPTATGAGNATASFTGGGAGCTYTKSVFIPLSGGAGSPPAGSAPADYTFPFGLFDFALGNCTPGDTITLTITYPQAVPAGAVYWKYGPTVSDPTPHWYQLPASIAGSTATFGITDGGLGDDDLSVNGTIVDQGGPGVPGALDSVAAIPTLSEWSMVLLAGMLGLFGMGVMRRRTS